MSESLPSPGELFLTSAAAERQDIPEVKKSTSPKTSQKLNPTFVDQEEPLSASVVVSIENFERHYPNRPPVMTEQATLEAMRQTGIAPEDIACITDKDLDEYPNVEEVRETVKKTLSVRREQKIQAIMKARSRILNGFSAPDSKRESFDAPKVINEEIERENQRIERLQKKEIEALIISELTRQKMLNQDLERQAKVEQTIAQREEETKRKLAEEAAKRKEKEKRVLERIEQQQKELEEKQKLQAIQDAERLMKEKEKLEMRRREAAELERARLLKLEQKQIEDKKRMQEEHRRAREREEALRKRDEERKRKNMTDTELYRNEKEKKRSQSVKRIEENTKREKELLEIKERELQEKEQRAAEAYAMNIKKRQEELEKRKRKTEEEIQRHKEIAAKLAEKEQEKKNQLQNKREGHEERVAAIISERKEKSHKARMEALEKERAAQLRREKRLLDEKAMYQLILKQHEEEKNRVTEIKQKSDVERQKSVALTKLKIKLMEANAKELERRKQFEMEEVIRKREEREAKALAKQEINKNLGRKRREAAIITTYKRKQVMEEFSNLMKQGGTPDLEALAQKFGLDLEDLKRKVEAGETGSQSSSVVGEKADQNLEA